MIDDDTPHKLAEIIRDTWPQLYYLKDIKKPMTFTVYSKNGCPYCTKVQQVLELAEVKHVIYKLDRDFTREEFYDKFGKGSTFPRVVKDEELIGGCTETVKYLREQKLV
ncbi:MAG: glutaredoxin [Euryarchaeota archaeon TMED129]|nr:MAG: glutaredoxin [Euryarchaeota archaeon TMED129]